MGGQTVPAQTETQNNPAMVPSENCFAVLHNRRERKNGRLAIEGVDCIDFNELSCLGT